MVSLSPSPYSLSPHAKQQGIYAIWDTQGSLRVGHASPSPALGALFIIQHQDFVVIILGISSSEVSLSARLTPYTLFGAVSPARLKRRWKLLG